MTDIVIAAAARTPVGSFNGALSSLPASDLGTIVITEVLKRAGVAAEDVSEVIMGQVLTAAQGQNPARQAALAAKIPVEKTAMTVNQVCGSSLRAVALGYQAIKVGDSSIVVAGGQESMSLSPHAAHLRSGKKMGDLDFIDTMIKDGLWCATNDYHMGNTAENVAQKFQITRPRRRPVNSRTRSCPSSSPARRAMSSWIPTNIRARAWCSPVSPSCGRPSPRTAR